MGVIGFINCQEIADVCAIGKRIVDTISDSRLMGIVCG